MTPPPPPPPPPPGGGEAERRLTHPPHTPRPRSPPAGARGERGHAEGLGRELPPAEVDAEDLRARRGVGQIDEENLVEAALAQQLRRRPAHGVRGRGDE